MEGCSFNPLPPPPTKAVRAHRNGPRQTVNVTPPLPRPRYCTARFPTPPRDHPYYPVWYPNNPAEHPYYPVEYPYYPVEYPYYPVEYPYYPVEYPYYPVEYPYYPVEYPLLPCSPLGSPPSGNAHVDCPCSSEGAGQTSGDI